MFFSSVLLGCLSLPLALAAPYAGTSLYARALVVSDPKVGSGIEARIEVTGHLDGRPSVVSVEVISGLYNNENSPYLYHFHTNPISPDGDCSSALGHLDPMNATESLTCDPAFPLYCQQGDISGKHGPLVGTKSGKIPTFAFPSSLTRFWPEDFSVLGRSVVIHSHNKTRLACGNITSTLDGTAYSNFKPTFKPSNFVTNYPTAPPITPAEVATPFVNGTFPTQAQLLAMSFPMPNPLIAISEDTMFVELLQAPSTLSFANATQTVTLPVEAVVQPYAVPFQGFRETW